MDTFTNNSNNGNKPALHKSRSNTAFSHATVNKSDVGDFQEGVFIMADMPTLPHRNKAHKTPERNQRKNEHSNNYRNQQTRGSTNHLYQQARESDTNVSDVRITTSPPRSPPKNKRIPTSHSPQRSQHQTTYTEPSTSAVPIVSPHKPHKANSQPHMHYEKRVERTESSLLFPPNPSSPSKQPKGPSPPRDRWAGPAFSNAPPPSSLPIPDFPPFNPAASSSLSSSPQSTSPASTSPPLPGPMFVPQQPMMMYREPMQYAPPHQPPVIYSPVAYGFPLHVMYEPSQPSLAQLSTDLRKMLNIGGQPILA